MTAEHVATAAPLTKELVADMRAELVHWLGLLSPGLSGLYRADEQTVKNIVATVMDEAVEHAQIRFAATLASFGVEQ